MGLQKWKVFPFYTIFIPLFFVWHICNDHFGLIPFDYSGKYFLFYTGISFFLLVVTYLFFRNIIKAGCLTAYCMFFILFWGPFHDLLKSSGLSPTFTSYKIVFSILIISGIVFILILRKNNVFSKTLNTFLNLLLFLFLLTEAIISGYKLITNTGRKNDYAYDDHNEQLSLAKINSSQKPDIFFIVFDEYASSASLKKYFNFDNSKFDSLLVSNNFYVAWNSKSNYNSTPVSIASVFNFRYFKEDLSSKKTEPKTLLKGQYTIKKSNIPEIFSKSGYSIVNLGICDFDKNHSPFPNHFNSYIDYIFYTHTLWGRVSKEILWNFPVPILFKWMAKESSDDREKVIQKNKYNYEKVLQELNNQRSVPKLVYAHVLAPHHPYNYDRKGGRREYDYFDFKYGDSLYLDQLMYINTLISPLIKASNQKFERPRVIMIAGDHGKRISKADSIKTPEKQFMNLSTFYFSDGNYSSLYDSISLVNNFRVVLNKYFSTSLPLLKDSTIEIGKF